MRTSCSTLQYPTTHTCSTHSTQCLTVPTVPCSTHGYCRSTQLPLLPLAVPTGTVQYPDTSTVPAVPAVPCSTHLQYPQYRDCRSTHGYCAVPARVTNYSHGTCTRTTTSAARARTRIITRQADNPWGSPHAILQVRWHTRRVLLFRRRNRSKDPQRAYSTTTDMH